MTFVNSFNQFKNGFLSGAGFGLGAGLSNFVNYSCFGFSNPFMYNCGFSLFGFNAYPTFTFPPPSPGMMLNNYAYTQNYQSQNLWAMFPEQTINISQSKIDTNIGWDTFNFSNAYNFNLTPPYTHDSTWNPYSTQSKPETKNDLQDSLTGALKSYNSTKGEKLAQIALSNKNPKGFNKECAKYVREALEKAGMPNSRRGDACDMADILKENTNFKEIQVSEVDWHDLPAGCILVYDKGAEGYSAEYGHVEITTGDGKAVSDGITTNIKKPSSIFIPV